MPTKSKQTRPAPQIRRSSGGRNAKQKIVFQRGISQPFAAAIVADSIYNLRLKPIEGPVVYKNVGININNGFSSKDFGIIDVYNDVYAIYKSLRKNLKGEKTFDTVKAGIDLGVGLHYILSEINKMTPAWMDINVERENSGKFYIVAYAYCPFPASWHCIPVKDVVLKLKNENKALHDLFLSFLRSFSSKEYGIYIDTWYNGYMSDMYDYVMEGELFQMQSEDDADTPEQKLIIEKYENDIHDYREGIAFKYQKLITKAKLMSGEELMKRAKRFKAGHPIANLIYQGATYMNGRKITDYTYYPFDGFDDETFLPLCDQLNIIWDEADNVSRTYEEHLDACANEGIQEPYVRLPLTTKTKEIDINKLINDREWMMQLSEYFTRAIDFINTYTKSK